MSNHSISVTKLLFERELGYVKKTSRHNLNTSGTILADQCLINRNWNKTKALELENSHRSVFRIEFSNNGGIAATSHTDRSISIINLSNMSKLGEIKNTDRTVWTLCFHPTDSNIIATGNLGGQACVYINYELFRKTFDNRSTTVASICFHPTSPSLIFFATFNKIIIWNWEEDIRVHELYTKTENSVRYLRFIPMTSMLITGISIKTDRLLETLENQETTKTGSIDCYTCLEYYFKIIDYLLDRIETFGYSEEIHYETQIWTRFTVFLESCRFYYGSNGMDMTDVNLSMKLFLRRLNVIDRRFQVFYDNHVFEPVKNVVLEQLNSLKRFLWESSVNLEVSWEFDSELMLEIFHIMNKIMSFCGNSDFFHRRDDGTIEPVAEAFNHGHQEYRIRYRLQVWKMEKCQLPKLWQEWRNVISTCSIHNDATVCISNCGKLISSFKVFNKTSIIEIYSLENHNLGERLNWIDTKSHCISLSISPSCKHLLLGVRAGTDYASIYSFEDGTDKLKKVRRYSSQSRGVINCLRWAPGTYGILIGYQLFYLRYIRFF